MILSILVAILALSILVFIHELFHFLIAKSSHIDTPVFSIGFGPKLFSFKWKETEFRISAILFGGYVQLKGMDPDEIKGSEDEFYSKNAPIRIATIFAGPFANILFGFLLYLGIFFIYGVDVADSTTIGYSIQKSKLEVGDKILEIDEKEMNHWNDILNNLKNRSKVLLIREEKEKIILVDTIDTDSLLPYFLPIIGNVVKNGPAYQSGLREGARILKIDGNIIEGWEDITKIVSPAIGESLDLLYVHNDDTIMTTVIPEEQKTLVGDSLVIRGMIGIVASVKNIKVPFLEAFSLASRQTWFIATWIFRSISLLIHRKVPVRDVAGAVGIVVMTKKSMEMGFINLLSFVALISVNLAILNLLPIPPLDGFHIVVSIVGSIFRRKPSGKLFKIIEILGFVILVSIMLFFLLNDLIRIFGGGM